MYNVPCVALKCCAIVCFLSLRDVQTLSFEGDWSVICRFSVGSCGASWGVCLCYVHQCWIFVVHSVCYLVPGSVLFSLFCVSAVISDFFLCLSVEVLGFCLQFGFTVYAGSTWVQLHNLSKPRPPNCECSAPRSPLPG